MANRYTLLYSLSAWVFILAAATTAYSGDFHDRYETHVFRNSKGETSPYRLMMPAHYDKTRAYPLVLFLHGAGERGDDNVAQLRHAMAEFATDANRDAYPCFVVAPQCPRGARWVEVHWGDDHHTMPAEPSVPLRLAIELVDRLEQEYAIDADRIYVTGLSMGGFGVWDAIQRFPKRFAAALPICGGGDPQSADRLTKIPLWVFHGDQDPAVKTERSREMVEAIQRSGGQPRYNEYPGVKHDSWTQTYRDADVLRWLFSQRRTAP